MSELEEAKRTSDSRRKEMIAKFLDGLAVIGVFFVVLLIILYLTGTLGGLFILWAYVASFGGWN